MARLFLIFCALSLCLTSCGGTSSTPTQTVQSAVQFTPTSQPTSSNAPSTKAFTPTPTIDSLAGYAVSQDGNWAQIYPAKPKDNPTPSTPKVLITPDFEATSLSNLNEIDCPTTLVCYVSSANGKIFGTFDGGKDWKTLYNGSKSLLSLSCGSETYCGAISREGLVLTSSNSGQNWKEHKLSLPEFSGFRTIECAGKTRCFIGGVPGFLYITQDSGASWQPYDTGSVSYFNNIDCTTEFDCVASGNGTGGLTYPPNVDYQKKIVQSFYTSDGGKTWIALASGNQGFATKSISCPTIKVCYSVEIPGSDVIILPLHILISQDRGASWSQVQIPGSKIDMFDFIECPTLEACYATSSTGMLVVTTNEGRTWEWSDSGRAYTLDSISCPAEKTCFAIANSNGGSYYGDLILTTTAQFPLAKPFSVPIPTQTPTFTPKK